MQIKTIIFNSELMMASTSPVCSDVTVQQLSAHSVEDLEVSDGGDDGSDVSQHAADAQQ